MNIARLDFFSKPPQMNYCKKEANQTFLGGILFFVYIAIMVIISAIYILDYFIKNKYQIQYSIIKNTEINALKMNEDKELNPMINMSIDFYKWTGETELSERFILFDWKKLNLIERGEFFQTKANDTFFGLLYACPDEECTLYENDTDPLGYFMKITYKGYKLDHQSETIPLDVNADRNFTEEYPFFFDNILMRRSQWEVIKYVEERGIAGLFDGMFDRKSEFISGFISSTESYTLNLHDIYDLGFKFKFLCLIEIQNNHYQYTEYKRTRKSFLDVLANIGALFSTFFAVFIFVYKYYSRNYDNYYLVDKILFNEKIKSLEGQNRKTKKMKDKELTSNILNIENNTDSKKESLLIGNKPHEKSLSTNDNVDINNDNDNEEEEEEIITNFKNLKFMDFILSNFNCKCCKKRNQVKIIDICNEILSKYISVDIILYNQIMMENLLKDYKWNDQKFSSLKTNDLILKLDKIT